MNSDRSKVDPWKRLGGPNLILRGFALGAGELHRELLDAALAIHVKARRSHLSVMKQGLRYLRERELITDSDLQRFEEMLKVFFAAKETREVRDTFAARLDEFRQDPDSTPVALALAGVVFHSVDRNLDDPVQVMRHTATFDALGIGLGAAVAGDGHNGLDQLAGAAIGGLVGSAIGAATKDK